MRPIHALLLAAGLTACPQGAVEHMPAPTATLGADTTAPTPTVVLPDSPAGRLAREFFDVLNRADVEGIRAYFAENSSPALLTAEPLDAALPQWKLLLEQAGGFDLVAVAPGTPGAEDLTLTLRARAVDRNLVITFTLDARGQFSMFRGNIPDPPDPGKLPTVAMPEAELAPAIARRVAELAAADRFSGVVLVLAGDRELVRAVHGHAEKSFAAPNNFDTKFNLGSMNKMFTGVAIGQLVEQGKLSFEDTVLEVLPDYPDRAFAEKATLHHLLTHSSGIGGNIFDDRMYEHRDRFKNPADYLPLFADAPPAFAPGERFGYANTGFIVLGMIIERVSGQSYYDYVHDHVFAPAGMRDTAAYAWDEVVPNLAVGYDPDLTDIFRVGPRRTNISLLPYRGSPAGGGYSTVPDLRAFAAALRGHRLLGAAMTETVTGPKIDFEGFGKYGYGFLTFGVEGRDVRGHSGGHLGINGALEMFWDGSYTVIVLANYGSGAAEVVAGEITGLLAAQRPS